MFELIYILKKQLNLPVMFWIYGGGYITGTSDSAFYNPVTLLEENVIVVNFNYRLGMFTPFFEI